MNKFLILLSLLISGNLIAQDQSEEEDAEKPSYWDRAKKAYEEIGSNDRDLSEETKVWVQEDLEKIGDWEYKVVELRSQKSAEIEENLNKMGEERWECFFVRETKNSITLMFKRQKISYLQKASKLDWSRLVGGSEE